MFITPNFPDNTPRVSKNTHDASVPLCFCTIYYVESIDNETLNTLVKKHFQDRANISLPKDLQHISYRFQYLTQEDLDLGHLRKRLEKNGINVDSSAADKTLGLLRDCLHADTGGYLVARQLPNMDITDDDENDEETVTCTETTLSLPLRTLQEAEQCIRDFTLALAKEDFQKLTGVSYGYYYKDKYEWKSHTSPAGTLGFLIRRLDIPEIDKALQKVLMELCQKGYIQPSDIKDTDNAAEALREIAKAIEDNKKIDTFCKLRVGKRGEIRFDAPNGKDMKCNFNRGILGRSLYLLFLRQVQRAALDPSGQTPTCICLGNLDEYKDELYLLYKEQGPAGHAIAWKRTIENYETKEAINDISRINSFFDKTFYLDIIEKKYNKNYCINRLEERDPKTGQSLYAVKLDAKDFDLDRFSTDRLKP